MTEDVLRALPGCGAYRFARGPGYWSVQQQRPGGAWHALSYHATLEQACRALARHLPHPAAAATLSRQADQLRAALIAGEKKTSLAPCCCHHLGAMECENNVPRTNEEGMMI